MPNWSFKKNQLFVEQCEKIIWEGPIQFQEITPSTITCSSQNYRLHIQAKDIQLAVLETNYTVILCENLTSFSLSSV